MSLVFLTVPVAIDGCPLNVVGETSEDGGKLAAGFPLVDILPPPDVEDLGGQGLEEQEGAKVELWEEILGTAQDMEAPKHISNKISDLNKVSYSTRSINIGPIY